MTWLTYWLGTVLGSASRDRRAGRVSRRKSWNWRNQQALALESLENRNLLSFVAPLNFKVGQSPVGVVAADFSHDDKPDLATVNATSNTVSVLIGTGHGTFKLARDYAVGSTPKSLAVADLTGNGNLDLVTANFSGTVSVLLGNGDGTFQPARNFPTSDVNAIATSVAVGDVNGDGIPDIVVGNMGQNDSVSVLLGNGDGTFKAPIKIALHNDVSSVAVGDVNGDHKLDVLAVVNDPMGLHSTVTVLMGNGNGTFRTGASYDIGDVGPGDRSLAVGDFNGDGKLDFAVATVNDVRVFPGNGDGTFGPPQILDAQPGYAAAVTVADVNRDGRPDLIVTAPFGVDVLLGNGDGTFQAPRTFMTGGNGPDEAAVADFTGDGNADLAAANPDSDTVSVLQGQGDGSFRTAPPPPVYGYAGALADLNGDGQLDLVAGVATGIDVLLGNGDGTFGSPVNYPVGGFLFIVSSVVVADLTGNGVLDIVATGPGFHATGNAVYVLMGNGDGTFQAPESFTVPNGPQSITVADLNGDGVPDLVVASPASYPFFRPPGHTISVLLGNGDGTFQPAMTYDVGLDPTAVAVADLNGDGIPDLVVTYGGFPMGQVPGGVDLLLGNGDGTFQDATTLFSGFAATALAVGDFNGDGLLDLAVADSSDGLVKVYQGNGDGTFQDPENYAVGPSPSFLAPGDFNGNGRIDLAVGGPFGVRLLTPKANGTFRVPATSFGPAATFAAVGDINGDGLPDLITGNAILFNRGHAHATTGVAGGHSRSSGHSVDGSSSALSLAQAPSVRPAAVPAASTAALEPASVTRYFMAIRSKGQDAVRAAAPLPAPAAREAARWMNGIDLDGMLARDLFSSLLE